MVLVQKWPFFELFFFRQYRPIKCLLRYSRTKKRLSSYKNKKFLKLKNWHFSKEVKPWFWSRNGHFFQLFFFSQYRQGKYLYDILERKNAFLDHKKNKFIKVKNWHFSKGVNPWFWFKNGLFSKFFFLGNIGQENVF